MDGRYDPGSELEQILDQELDTAALAARRGQGIYQSVQKLSRLIGGEYGDRVIFELLQNAHDANINIQGNVALRLVVSSDTEGTLYVANGGHGFSDLNLQAVRNIANSTKEIGEGIGNKGVGFRSVEALTDDPHIYSCKGEARAQDCFDGYCFRFARQNEIRARLETSDLLDVAEKVSEMLPRYLAAVPVVSQPEDIRKFAREGFATVVVLPLKSSEAVSIAIRQITELIKSEAPVLLFLGRLASLEITVEGVSELRSKTLTREVQAANIEIAALANCRVEIVTLGPPAKRWLVLHRTLPKEDVLDAVQRSVTLDPGLSSWLDWRGDAIVSVAIPIEGFGLHSGRLYNFLPMGSDSEAPLFGHLDAPFYTKINRERAKMDLPLNSYLMDAAAQLCAAGAIAFTSHPKLIPERCVVDLFAWLPPSFPRLQAAFKKIGTTLGDAKICPANDGDWGSLRSVRSWPEGSFSIFTARRAINAGAKNILSSKLSKDRVKAIQALGQIIGVSPNVTDKQIADWAVMIASGLSRSKTGLARWGTFYGELQTVLTATKLPVLAGRNILVDRNGDLIAAGPDVYVREVSEKKTKKVGEAPLPPRDVARKLSLLSDALELAPGQLEAFERAKLWRKYDGTEVLERLSRQFGDKPAPARRAAALGWAFEVWRHDGARAKKALKSANLHVPTLSGWTPADQAAFSTGWTRTGRQLEEFLLEAQNFCADCKHSVGTLLVPPDQWPAKIGTSVTEWVRFLQDAGVIDGIVPLPAKLPTGPQRGDMWWSSLSSEADTGLDGIWRANHGFVGVGHPYTNYWRVGEAWKVPGQTIVKKLSDEARVWFAWLLAGHLQAYGLKYLTFVISRQDREERLEDSRQVWTPLATFLFAAEWLPVISRGDVIFSKPSATWLITDRRTDPKFVPRATDEIVDLLPKDGKAFAILCGQPFGLRI